MIARNQRPSGRVLPGMNVVRSSAVITAALALAASGCASQAGAGGAGGSATGSPPAVTTAAPTPSTGPDREPVDPTNPALSAGRTVTIVGVVTQGAEPGCRILQTKQGQFELLAATSLPGEGAHVTVVGHVVKAMSHCMQGSPFLVEKWATG